MYLSCNIDTKPPRLTDTSVLENIRILAQTPSPNLLKYLIPLYVSEPENSTNLGGVETDIGLTED